MIYEAYKRFRQGQSLLPGPNQSATKLASALALGLMLGMVPKGNLVAAAIFTIILATTVHKSMAVLTAFVVGLGSGLIDPVTHHIGHAILTYAPLQTTWSTLIELPLVAWTGLNNTVVMGSSVVGMFLFVPAYRLSKPVFQKYWVKTTNDAAEERRAPSDPPSLPIEPNNPDGDKDVGKDITAENIVTAKIVPGNELAAKRQLAQIAAELKLHRCDILPTPEGRRLNGPHGLPLKPISPSRRFAAGRTSATLPVEASISTHDADTRADHYQQALS